MSVLDLIDPDLTPFPGAIVIATVTQRSIGDKGKVRPMLLTRPHPTMPAGWWAAIGLTSLSHHADGTPRVEMADSEACGLEGRSFLWRADEVSLRPAVILGVVWAASPAALASVGAGYPQHRAWAAHATRVLGWAGWSWPKHPPVEVTAEMLTAAFPPRFPH